jgi:anti-anti-sigma factor
MSATMQHALEDGIAYLKLGGELRHDNAGALEGLLEHWFDPRTADVHGVVIDLNEARFMDSTVIGLLATIARELDARGLPRATVFSTDPEINHLLRSLCLDEVFVLVEQATDRRPQGPLQMDVTEGDAAHCHPDAILAAHEVLVALNEANRIAFQPVVELLRADLSRHD